MKIDHLPALISGTDGAWAAQRLNKVGTRDSMKCIYKLALRGERKRAGVYVSMVESHATYSIYHLNIAGKTFYFSTGDLSMEFEDGSSKYAFLKDDRQFRTLVAVTVENLDSIPITSSIYKPVDPAMHILTEEEVVAIPAFGLF